MKIEGFSMDELLIGKHLDNYSTKGNVNPYTGQAGTVDPYKIDATPYSLPAIKPIDSYQYQYK